MTASKCINAAYGTKCIFTENSSLKCYQTKGLLKNAFYRNAFFLESMVNLRRRTMHFPSFAVGTKYKGVNLL